MLKLDEHDEALVALAKAAIEKAISSAHLPVAVTKRISAYAVRHRNIGRAAAMKRHAFKGICEASGKALERICVATTITDLRRQLKLTT